MLSGPSLSSTMEVALEDAADLSVLRSGDTVTVHFDVADGLVPAPEGAATTVESPTSPVADLGERFSAAASLSASKPEAPSPASDFAKAPPIDAQPVWSTIQVPTVSAASQQALRTGLTLLPNGRLAYTPPSTTQGGRSGKADAKSRAKPAKPSARRIVSADLASGGPLDLADPSTLTAVTLSLSAVAQASLAQRFGFSALQVRTAGGEALPPVLVSPGWETAGTLVVLVASPGTPAGLWSVPLTLRHGLDIGSVLPLVGQLLPAGGGAGGSGNVAVVVADSAAPDVPLHLGRLVDFILTSASKESASESVSASGPSLVLITHGPTAWEAALSVLGEGTSRGALARLRTKAVAALAPQQDAPQRAPTTPQLRPFLRQRVFGWMAHAAPVPAPEGSEDAPVPSTGSSASALPDVPARGVDPVLAAVGEPAMSEGAAFYSARVSVEAPAEPAGAVESVESIACDALPALVAQQVALFTSHMSGVAVAGAALTPAPAFGKATAASFAALLRTQLQQAAPAPATPTAPAATSAPPAAAERALPVDYDAITAPVSRSGLTRSKSRAAMLLERADRVIADAAAASTATAASAPSAAPTAGALITASVTPASEPAPAPAVVEVPVTGAAESGPQDTPQAPLADGEPSTPATSEAAPAPIPAPTPAAPPSGFAQAAELSAPFAAIADAALSRLRALKTDEGSWKSAGVVNGVATYTYNSAGSRVPPAASAGASSAPAGGEAGDGLVGARGDAVLPFPPSALLQFLVHDGDATRGELDPGLDFVRPLRELSGQARVERMAMKGVFPTDPRDFVVLSSWRADEAGGLAIFATSCDAAIATGDAGGAIDAALRTAAAPAKKFVRGTLDIGGWLIEPLASEAEYKAGGGAPLPPGRAWAGGSRVSYAFRTSIGGNIPKMIVKAVTAGQAALPAAVAKAVEKRLAKGSPSRKVYAALAAATPVSNIAPEGTAVAAPDSSATATAADAQPPTVPDDGAAGASTADGDATAATSEEAPSSAPVDAAPDAGSQPPSPATLATPTVDLGGVWKLDRSRSDSVAPMLQSMGIGLLLRKMIDGLDITTTIAMGATAGSGTAGTIALEDSSRFGKAVNTFTLDWQQRELKGQDGKVALAKAVALCGVDGVPADAGSFEDAVAAYRKEGPPPSPLGPGAPYPLHGPGSGVVLIETVLPDGLGTTREERHLADPSTLRLVTIYVRDGAVKNRLTRYLQRQDEIPPRLLAPPPPLPAAVPSASTAAAAPVDASGEGLAVEAEGASSSGAQPSPADDAAAPPTPQSGPTAAPATPQSEQPPAAAPLAPPAPSPWSASRWIPDDLALQQGCGICARPFTAGNRVHHCRHCGGAFCNEHSRARVAPAHLPRVELEAAGLAPDAPVRACDRCALPIATTVTSVPTSGGRVLLMGGCLGTRELALAGGVSVRLVAPAGSKNARGQRLAVRIDTAHTRISFVAPPGCGEREASVTVDGRETRFVYRHDPPVLLGLAAPGGVATPCTEGGVITLRGFNLGDAAALAAGKVSVALTSGPGQAVSVPVLRVMQQHTALLVQLPPASCPHASLSVTVGGQASEKPLPLIYSAPAVYAVRVSREPALLSALDSAPDATRSGSDDGLSEESDVAYVTGDSLGADPDALSITVRGVSVAPASVSVVVPHCKVRVVLPLAAGDASTLQPADVAVTVIRLARA